MKVSIIIPSLVKDEETLNHLANCLDFLKKNTPRELYQLIIVDNGSALGVEMMQAEADIYIRKDYAMGYTRATNLGLALADGDYLCVLNNDLYVPEGWLEKMLKVLEMNGNGSVAPMDTPNEERTFMNSAWGALWIVPREVFTKVGYMDESLNWRYSDQDYWIKIRKAGYNVMRTGTVVVRHFESTTYKKLGKGMEEESEKQAMLARWGASTFHEWINSEGGKEFR